MDRRLCIKAVATSLGLRPLVSSAQAQFVEGKHYVVISPRQPTKSPKQVEVLEFFAYGCSHCNAFEPAIDAWQKRLPPDVVFRRIPVAFREVPGVVHQRLYFAIESLELVEQLHRKVFTAIHVDRQRLDKPEDIGEFVARNGVDQRRFMDTFGSFSVAIKAKQATALVSGYKVEGTPSMGVDGRWLTNGSMAGHNEGSLVVADYLISMAKKGA